MACCPRLLGIELQSHTRNADSSAPDRWLTQWARSRLCSQLPDVCVLVKEIFPNGVGGRVHTAGGGSKGMSMVQVGWPENAGGLQSVASRVAGSSPGSRCTALA